MSVKRLERATRLACMAAAAVGLLVTLAYLFVFARAACCDATFWLISGRFALDFVGAPLAVGLSLGRFSVPGRVVFWSSCGWMAFLTWPPFLIPLVALGIWTRVRLREECSAAPALSGHANP